LGGVVRRPITSPFEQAAIEQAKHLAIEGRLHEAERRYLSVLAKHPNSPDALAGLGAAYLLLDRPAEALQTYDRLIALKPGDADAHYNRGVVLSNLARPEEALASYQRALALAPNHVRALFNGANTLALLDRNDDALAGYDKVLALQPDHVEALNQRGYVLRKLGRDAEASLTDDDARGLEPDDVGTRNYVGGLHEPDPEAMLDTPGTSLDGEQTRRGTLANASDRVRLTPAAVAAIVRLSSIWKLSGAETRGLLGGMSERSFARLKSGGWSGTLSQDELTRISALIAIFKDLHLLFSEPLADDWPKIPNKGPLFRGLTPVGAMIEGGIPAMIATRRYLDALRGGA
jgi:tetratricopeptide (TPR) repeat protein